MNKKFQCLKCEAVLTHKEVEPKLFHKSDDQNKVVVMQTENGSEIIYNFVHKNCGGKTKELVDNSKK
jgi:hypothetical protein